MSSAFWSKPKTVAQNLNFPFFLPFKHNPLPHPIRNLKFFNIVFIGKLLL